MRILLLLLIVCLLAAAPVSAIAASPAAVPGITKVSSVIRPDNTIIPVRTIVSTTPDVWVTLGINSFPSGAAITVDGDPVEGRTPVNLGLRPGLHTLRLTLAGYEDSVTEVSLQAGSPTAVDIVLEPSRNMVAARANVSAMRTVQAQNMINRTILPEVIPSAEIFAECSLSPQKCLTLAEAAAMYPQG
ncbi:MAG TPA: PEGA domain-containing protein, partial [Methanoregula sp.]|nr:PEGA domain-containing protein [Methanoregula sp.]